MAKIQVENLIKIFGNRPEKALQLLNEGVSKDEILKKTKHAVGIAGVSFHVNEGEVFVVMGLSGSGKSTLIRCLNRLIETTSGQVYLDGEDIVKMNNDELREVRRSKLGMVFQKFALFPHKTVLENVEYGLEIQGVNEKDRKSKAVDALKLVGLDGWGDNLPTQLSGGMQQRVGLARALAIDPDILLMDEAFSALDPLIRKEMQDELLELQSKMNKTIIFITHDLDEALKIGDRIALMKDGLIVQIGTPEDILKNPANDYVARFVEDVDMTKVLSAKDVMIKAVTLDDTKDGPRVALRKMKTEKISGLFLTDKKRTLKGYLSADDVSSAVKKDQTNFEGLIQTDIITVSPDTMLVELFPLIADAKIPVAVVDEENKLKGIIIRGTVLAALARGEDEFNDQ
ncbi:glycine betaine/L-proline ABC transporter, ATPase subunit [Alkaliphilus metalliredigens QYMF]|uniref:Quaternary amine transport ATP-binding protein n=1 Tax=Alkaliphilus metalliredigens (strain QYMF) TaxID=293826 RepID=A6TRZ0_ALKMQ|nr:glycine betaine/L-proline ABC transporter ATP-binding protein [Alkaliphilus metalliredigens]ABR48958.1 glycine betaine/L-proline ABC transporter, ATPase subunit [Alkaliphilus metalliredigens QYMF]